MMILITPLIFLIELFSNMIRPGTLGIRLFANMYADEQIAAIISGLFPPFTQILVPVILLPLAVVRRARADVCFHAAFDDLHQRRFART